MTCPKSLIKVYVRQSDARGRLTKQKGTSRRAEEVLVTLWGPLARSPRPCPARKSTAGPVSDLTSGLWAAAPGSTRVRLSLTTAWFSGSRRAPPPRPWPRPPARGPALRPWPRALPSASSQPASRAHKTQWGAVLVPVVVARALSLFFFHLLKISFAILKNPHVFFSAPSSLSPSTPLLATTRLLSVSASPFLFCLLIYFVL